MAAFPMFVYLHHNGISRFKMYHECHFAAGATLLYTNHVNCLVYIHTRLTVNGFLKRLLKERDS